MKILFVGSTKGTACSHFYFTSMVRLGHQVLPFDPEYFMAGHPIEKFLIRLNHGPTQAKRKRVSTALLQICRKNRFDAVFVMAENFMEYHTMEEIKQLPSPPLFLYHSHDNNFSKGICKPYDFGKTIAAYDYVFTTKSQNVARYAESGQEKALFIPSAYEPTVHHPITDSYSRYKGEGLHTTFIGTYDCSRDVYLEAIGFEKLRVWGNGWQRYRGYNEFRDRISPDAIYYFEFADILSHSSISLGLLRQEAEDRHTQRTFEIPACGALQIAPRNEEILSFFNEDEEIVLFSGPEELRDKVNYYITHESERGRIAKRGYERCLGDPNTYLDRVSTMLTLASKNLLLAKKVLG